jgi:general secretion pathway protein D
MYVEQGRVLLRERKIPQAIEFFKRAMTLDPFREEHQTALAEALRFKEAQESVTVGEKLLAAGRFEEAAQAFEHALELDPGLKEAQAGIVKVAEKQRAVLPPLMGTRQPITLKFQNAKIKEVFEALARSAGINVLFDKDLKDDPVTIFIKDATFESALNLVLATQSLFMRRVAPDTILIIPKTKQKIDQYQDLLIRTFYLSNSKAKDMVNLLRTMLESKRVFVNEDLNAIVIRDSPDKIRLAERIIFANDRRGGEVMFEIEVLEVDKTKSDKYGVNFAKQAGASFNPPGATTFPAAGTASTFTFQQLTSINQASYLFTLPASVILDFLRTESDAKTLANPKIRVVNNKQAKINIGDKVPILLSTTSTIPGVVPGTIPTSSTITSIEFKDTGVKLTVEPTIHLNYEVTLKLQIEVTRLGDQVVLQDNPLIKQFRFGTRTAETSLTLRDGESVVIGGLIQDEDRTTVTKVPGLGEIPVLGELFKTTTRDVVRTDVILTITPRIVRPLEVPRADEQAFWSGTEETYTTRPMFTDVAGGAGLTVPTPPPAAQAPPPRTPALPAPPFLGSPAASLAPAILTIRPPDGAVQVGKETNLDVMVAGADGLAEATLTVSYDPKVMEFRQALEGEFLKRSGSATITVDANPVVGSVVVRIKGAQEGQGVSGSGVLVTLAFEGKAPGVSPVSIQAPNLVSAGKAPIAATGGQGVLRVR